MPEDDPMDNRSKNAKAQARHRAKRKQEINNLKLTVEKLRAALGLSWEQAEALPEPYVPSRMRELEAENQHLQLENVSLRRQLACYQQQTGTSTGPLPSLYTAAPGVPEQSPPISPSGPSEGESSIYPSPLIRRNKLNPDESRNLSDLTRNPSSAHISRSSSRLDYQQTGTAPRPGQGLSSSSLENTIPGAAVPYEPINVPSTSPSRFASSQRNPDPRRTLPSLYSSAGHPSDNYGSHHYDSSSFRPIAGSGAYHDAEYPGQSAARPHYSSSLKEEDTDVAPQPLQEHVYRDCGSIPQHYIPPTPTESFYSNRTDMAPGYPLSSHLMRTYPSPSTGPLRPQTYPSADHQSRGNSELSVHPSHPPQQYLQTAHSAPPPHALQSGSRAQQSQYSFSQSHPNPGTSPLAGYSYTESVDHEADGRPNADGSKNP